MRQKGTASRARLQAGLLLVLVAALGFVAGIVTDRLLMSESALAAFDEGDEDRTGRVALFRSGGPDTATEGRRVIRLGLPDQLAEDLELSAAQRAEIERIVAEDQAKLRELLERVEPSLTAVIQESRERITAVLTDEQIARWQETAVILRRPAAGPPPDSDPIPR